METRSNVLIWFCLFLLFVYLVAFTMSSNRHYEDLRKCIDSVSVKCDTIYNEVYMQNVALFD